VNRLTAAPAYEPCSPTCANWLRYGIEPKNPRPGLLPGGCKGKAHRPDHLGYAGRRVLVSRKWSGKTLADHRGDRRAWLIETLGLSATDVVAYRWEPVHPGDPDDMPRDRGCCMPSPTGSPGRTLSTKPDAVHGMPWLMFQRRGGAA
jgi:hypothetical protein